ncbi:MAG: hypothetical protein NZ840_03800 [Anaerolineales bacterium]|nr:hypothetical protein [Anaerolineales bacterium]MDW8161158.1 hypothetical protein [Anaerolineales bacterium]
MPTSSSSPSDPIRVLLTSLVFLSLFILTLIFLVFAYPVVLAPPPTATSTITLTPTITPTITQTPTITLTPTRTLTPRPTSTPSVTLTPSRTPIPSATPTPPGPPTLTPASPFGGEANYALNAWTEELAAALVELIQDYPNTLPHSARGEDDRNYNSAFAYAAFAQSEALLRFPDSRYAAQWRWQQALNYARLGDPKAGDLLASLLERSLNGHQTTLAGLSEWIGRFPLPMKTILTPLRPPSGILSASLLELSGRGSAFFLIVETPAAFKVYPLLLDFDFSPLQTSSALTATLPAREAPRYQAFRVELTGDRVEELVIYRTNPREMRWLSFPKVYDLSALPPVELPFDPIRAPFQIGMSYLNLWDVRSDEGGKRLSFSTRLFPACPLDLERDYIWERGAFLPLATRARVYPYEDTLSYCGWLVEHAASVWDRAVAVQLIDALLPLWPPAADPEGKPYPPDAKDEWRFRKAVYLAEMGDFAAAHATLEDLLSNPSTPSSRWLEVARRFRQTYQTPDDLYRACITTTFCRADSVLASIIEHQDTQRAEELLGYLDRISVIRRSTGYFDFDGDGSKEFWFAVQHRLGEKLEVWALFPRGNRLVALQVRQIENLNPTFSYYDPNAVPPVILLNQNQAFQVLSSLVDRHPYIRDVEVPRYYPDKFKEALDRIEEELFQGASPEQTYRRLVDLQKLPGLLCRATWSCDRYYYLLGLAAELSGDQKAAVAAYYRLWMDYGKSPFATMARLKLRSLSTPTFTPTPTFTQTPSQTPSPTKTPPLFLTPSPTGLPTPTVGPFTPTSAPLPTLPTPYPGPNQPTAPAPTPYFGP